MHAWLHKNFRHLEDCSNVSLYPPSFISKNQLANDGPNCVAPVIIWLWLLLLKSLLGWIERSVLLGLCVIIWTEPKIFTLARNWTLSPSGRASITISSWIEQMVVLCYQLWDEQAQTLCQVKALQGGVPLDYPTDLRVIGPCSYLPAGRHDPKWRMRDQVFNFPALLP